MEQFAHTVETLVERFFWNTAVTFYLISTSSKVPVLDGGTDRQTDRNETRPSVSGDCDGCVTGRDTGVTAVIGRN